MCTRVGWLQLPAAQEPALLATSHCPLALFALLHCLHPVWTRVPRSPVNLVPTRRIDCLQLLLSGESSTIKYAVEPTFVDCGTQAYDRAVDRDLWVS
jgi:hypothetical protein